MLAMDYRRVREVLRECRFQLDLGVKEIAEKSGLERTTIYRIENLKELPDYKPDLETIEAVIKGLGLTLSAFFARVENTGLQALPSRSTDRLPPASEDARGNPSAVPETSELVTDTLIISAAEQFAAAIDRLIASREQAPAARRPTPRRVRHRRKTG